MIAIPTGVATAISQWSKNVGPDGAMEKFDLKQLWPSLVIGGVVGGIAAWQGWSFDQAQGWFASSGMFVIAQNLLKFGHRQMGVPSLGLGYDLKNPDAKP